MGSIRRYFVSTEFCGLCRGQFPESSLQGFDAWQSEFRAVLLLDPHNEHTVEITDVASLPDIRDDVDVTLAGHPQLETVTICRDLQVNVETPRDGPAFCFHDWCYSSLTWGVRCHPPKSIIYKLVRTLVPNSSLWENICEGQHQLDPGGGLQTLIAYADQFPHDLQLLFMSKLPTEVRVRIWEYVGLSTPYSAFILVARESSRLARHVKSRPTRNFALKRGCHLSAKTIMVFGTEYIQDLGYDEDHKVRSGFIGDVTGLKFVTSLSGICAIKVFGVDWETEWLGKVPCVGHVWHGMIQDVGPRLRCAYNDLNCVNISNLEPSANLILWDQPNFPLSLVDPDKELFDFERDIIGSSRSSVTTCERRFFRYLPLCNGNDAEYIKGLTLYQTGNGIVGLEAHFTQTSQLSGCRDGRALYIPLCPNERISYAWLRILNYSSIAFAAPTLIIQTTLRRVYSFGSYILPDMVVRNQYQWILLKNKGCITGFYYENSASHTIIMRLGVADDGAFMTCTPLTPQYPARVLPPIAGPNGGVFLTVAFLGGFEKIDLCRVSGRCTGMLVHYPQGPPSVLGQWHSSCVAEHLCIYSSGTKSINNIYFRISSSENCKIVTHISFSEDNCEATPDSQYHIFNLGMHIAWWFSELCDVILPWTGEYRDIPAETKVNQDQFIA